MTPESIRLACLSMASGLPGDPLETAPHLAKLISAAKDAEQPTRIECMRIVLMRPGIRSVEQAIERTLEMSDWVAGKVAVAPPTPPPVAPVVKSEIPTPKAKTPKVIKRTTWGGNSTR